MIKQGKSILLHPLTRGMVAYSILWPTGSIIQQTLAGQKWGKCVNMRWSSCGMMQHKGNFSLETYDWTKCFRFSAYGALFVAPTLFAWVRFSGRIWPQRDLRTAMKKALVEQVTYGPFASATFFFAMTYMETRNTALARQEVADKFLPTYKVYT